MGKKPLADRCRVRGAQGVGWLEFYPMCLPHPVGYSTLEEARRKAEFFNRREDLKAFEDRTLRPVIQKPASNEAP